MFGITLSNARLYVPYNKVTAYKNAGWTGFSAYNIDGIQAHDIYTGDVGYTVTSTAATTVNGTSYAGRVKVVCYGGPANNSSTAITIPASVTNLGKTYAVTMIGEDAFNNHTDDFTVSGCANVDTVGAYAFQNQAITKYPFGHNSSRYIMGYAFEGAGFTGTVALPYGVITIGGHAFGNGKYSRIIFPASVGQHWGTAVTGTTTLTEFIWNQNWGRNYTGWDFTGVPSNCYIRVPTGLVGQWKQNSALSSRANYITAGAYDFAFNNAHSGGYYCTIISNSSTTYNGTTYAGKAKYVYNPIIQNSTSTGTYIFASNEEDRTVSGDYRKYLITEIGDSLLYGSKYTGGNIPASVTRIGQSAFRNCEYAVNNLKLPDGLTFVGHDAFYGSKITGEIKIPASVTQLDEWAFCTATLGALYFPGAMPTMGTTVWSANNSDFVAWVPNQYANTYLTKANGWGSEYGMSHKLINERNYMKWYGNANTNMTYDSILVNARMGIIEKTKKSPQSALEELKGNDGVNGLGDPIAILSLIISALSVLATIARAILSFKSNSDNLDYLKSLQNTKPSDDEMLAAAPDGADYGGQKIADLKDELDKLENKTDIYKTISSPAFVAGIVAVFVAIFGAAIYSSRKKKRNHE